MRYGQRHSVEIEAARRVARASSESTRHVELEIDLRGFGGSALTADLEVPKDRSESTMTARNSGHLRAGPEHVFLSLALAWAETLAAFDIFVGVNCVDYSGYPDCRPEYLRSFEDLANLATRAGVERRGPIPHPRSAPDLDQGADHRARPGAGRGLRADPQLLRPDSAGLACGRCDACRIRRSAFERSGPGGSDPLRGFELMT